MTKWKTDIKRGFGFGIALMTLITLADASLIGLTATRPLNFGTFIVGMAVLLSFGLLGLIGYWVYGLVGSAYLLDRNALVVRWGPTEQTIPINEIERVFTGSDVEGGIVFRGGMWPGHWVGYGEFADEGQTLFYATVPPQEQIYVVTPGLVYGISPADHEAFLKSLQKRLQMGPTQVVEQSSRRPGVLNWPFWRDRLGMALPTVNLLALLALVGLFCFRFPSLPLLVPLHFDVLGNPDRFGPRGEIFIMPLISALALVINGVLAGLLYRYERVASYLLWGGALLVQVLVWAAALGILGQL